MEILLFTSLIVFLLYITVSIGKFGIPKSISETAYLYGKKGRTIFYTAFTLFIIPLMIYWLDITQGEPSQPLVFLSCAALCFTGITGKFKPAEGALPNRTHIIATIIAAILSMIWVYINIANSWIFIYILVLLGIFGSMIEGAERKTPTSEITKSNSIIFWLEIGLFFIAYSSVIKYGML